MIILLHRRPDCGDGGAIVCKAAGTIAPDNPAAKFLIMTDLMQIISNGQANVRLEITGEDLHNFSNELITRAVSEVAAALKGAEDDRLLTRDEVKDMCGVCDTTLWLWNKRNYLKAVKVGSKVRYRFSDVRRILGKTDKSSGYGRE